MKPLAPLRLLFLRLRSLLPLLGLCLAAQPIGARADAPRFASKDQELMYYWGTTFAEEVTLAGIKDAKDVDWILRGLRDSTAGKAPEFPAEYRSLLNNYLERRSKEAAQAEEPLSLAYVKEQARQPHAIVTESGLVYRELVRGTGAQPTRDSKVKVDYVGTLRDGRVFDSSRERGQPLETRLTAVIACWSEGIPMMKVGGKARITCPPALAYGDDATVKIPAGSALTFEVELLGVEQ